MISRFEFLDVRQLVAVRDVLWERDRQEQNVRDGRFEFTCADREGMTDHERLTVLMEEVGELARELLTQDGRRLARDTIGTPEALRAELVQVVAVGLAWLEAYS